MTICIGAVTIREKRIPIHFASFATVELIDSDLNITAEAFELCLFIFAESFFDLILVHGHDTDEKLVRSVKITGLNRFVHELVQLIGKLNGDSGHGGLIVSRLARFVESVIQRGESSAPTSLPTIQYSQHLWDDFGGEEGVAAIIRMQATQHAILHRQRSGDGGAEVDEGEFFV